MVTSCCCTLCGEREHADMLQVAGGSGGSCTSDGSGVSGGRQQTAASGSPVSPFRYAHVSKA